MNLPNDWRVYAIVVGAGAAAIYFARRTLGQVASAVNPLNSNNVFSSAVNDVGAQIAGQPAGSWSLGSSLFEWWNPQAVAAEKAAIGQGMPASSSSDQAIAAGSAAVAGAAGAAKDAPYVPSGEKSLFQQVFGWL